MAKVMDTVKKDLGPCLNSVINQLHHSVCRPGITGLEAHLTKSLFILNSYNSSFLIPGRIDCVAYPRKRSFACY